VGLAQTLVAWLAGRYDRGETLAVHDSYRISESLWIAARDGAHAALPDLETGEREPVARRLGRLLDELAPVAAELGTERELARVSLLSRVCGAERQRERVRRLGVDGLVDWLAQRTLVSARHYLVRTGVAPISATRSPVA
jgi:carboxylate-amine ligase